jgi:hypothetical protein
VLRDQYPSFDIEPAATTVRDLIRRPARFGRVDLVYAAGLYDYLEDSVARALTTALFRMLNPGGRLLIANFTPATADAAFMEAILDWHLTYRTEEQTRNLLLGIDTAAIAAIEQFSDENGCITYLRVLKQ